MKSTTILVIGLVLVLAVFSIAFIADQGKNSLQQQQKKQAQQNTANKQLNSGLKPQQPAPATQKAPSPAPQPNTEITLQELSTHNVQEDCWVGFEGKVYDLTDFLPKHPGSAGAIAPYCGTAEEFAKAFASQHGASQIGRLERMGVMMGMMNQGMRGVE